MLVPRENARRLIVVLTPAELDRCSYDDDGAQLLRTPGVWLVPDTAAQNEGSDPLIMTLDRAGLFVPGNLLVQMPYDPDCYEPAEDAPQRAAERKHLLFTELCQLLGAKRVQLKVLETQSETGDARVEVTGTARCVTGSGDAERKTADDLAATMTLEDRYSGGPPDIEAAHMHLKKTCLDSDPLMRSLVSARMSGNALLSRKYTVDLSRETSRQLKVMAQVKVPGFLSLEGSAHFATTSRQKHRATYEVAFA